MVSLLALRRSVLEFEAAIVMKKIIHIDMDAFFASVEQRDNPEYRGKPVVVGGASARRGVVCSASYEARAFGVRSAMPSKQAAELCPHAIFLPVRMDAYRDASNQIMGIFSEYSDMVEAVSIDEAYLDVTTNKKNLPLARDVAKALRAEIFNRTGLTASAGVAPNKLLAKIASDMNKPNGLKVVPPEMVHSLLETLPVRKFPGVGPATEAKLLAMGIETTRDILALPPEALTDRFGRFGARLVDFANGIDNRTVKPDRTRKSIGVERTYFEDLRRSEEVVKCLGLLAERLTERLRSRSGHTLTLKVKFSDFRSITRAETHEEPFTDTASIFRAAEKLFHECVVYVRPIRLLGLSISHLVEPGSAPRADSLGRQFALPLSERISRTRSMTFEQRAAMG